MRRAYLGAFLLAALTLAAAGQDKSKKAIEVVYDDVQLLKKQVQELRALADQNAEVVKAIQDQLKALTDLFRQTVSGQAASQEDLRALPAQYQDIVRKLDQITIELQKISAELAARPAPVTPAGAPAAAAATGAEEKKTAEPPAKAEPKAPAAPVLTKSIPCRPPQLIAFFFLMAAAKAHKIPSFMEQEMEIPRILPGPGL